jgi:hypothetical protein
MGIKVIEHKYDLKECPNQAKHIAALVEKLKDQHRALAWDSFTPRKLSTDYCNRCGARLIDVHSTFEEEHCDQCDERLGSGDIYCPHCGVQARPVPETKPVVFENVTKEILDEAKSGF